MKHTLRLSLIATALLMPLMVFAAPQNVSGITATNENGGVRVSWNKVNDPDIVNYRIFFSHASILSNNGVYDDFETVSGAANTHLLQSLPPASEIFVTMLAVNSKGEESLYFAEEAKVTLGTVDAGSSSSMAVTMPNAVGNELRLLSAQAVSSTGVLLRFSHPVSIPQAQALQAILIERQSGSTLAMRRFVIEGTNVIVHTAPQMSGMPYRVTIGSMVTGKKTDGTTVALASDQLPVLFVALGNAVPSSSASSMPANSGRSEVAQLRLRAEPEAGSKYMVEATWQAPVGSVVSYSIAQTTNGGQSYTAPRVVNASTTGVKINGIPAGTNFGVLVKTKYSDGVESTGTAQMITLPGKQTGTIDQPINPGKLPSSGPEMYVLIMTIGAAAGMWTVKQRELKAQRA